MYHINYAENNFSSFIARFFLLQRLCGDEWNVYVGNFTVTYALVRQVYGIN